jgi:predicted O-methyltransferase YrrM
MDGKKVINMIKDIIEVSNEILDSIDLTEYQNRRNVTKLPEHWFFMKSGKEHYRLLCYISSLYTDVTIIDIGTWVGSSALALGSNKKNKVILSKVKKSKFYNVIS